LLAGDSRFIERGAPGDGLVIKGSDKGFDGMVRPFERETDDLSRVPIEYPYHFLSEYLSERGFPHLAQLVPWRGAQGKDLPGRSKHFINMLKCNIQHHGSGLSQLISKNEAHIRLASSVWYAASYIARFSIVGIAVSAIAGLLSSDMHLAKVVCVALPVATLIMAVIVQGAIEKSLHYQRCREIFLVLHVAALVGREKPGVLYGIQRPTAWTRLKESRAFHFSKQG
jgi:hypothetical protein